MWVPKTCLFLDLAENREERWLHPMCVDVALPRVLKAEVVHAEDLVEDVLDVCVTLTTTTTAGSSSSPTYRKRDLIQGVFFNQSPCSELT